MNIFSMMDDDVLFVAQGGGVLSVECCTGIMKAFEEYGKIPGHAQTSSGGTLFSSLYYSGHDTNWFRELMSSRKLSEFFSMSPISSIGCITGCSRHLVNNDGVKKLLEEEMTGSATLRVRTSLTKLVDWSGCYMNVTPAVALAATSIPWVFKPVKIGEELYADGGVVNNIPVPSSEQLEHYKHVYVFLTPPSTYNDTTDDPLIVGLLELLQAVMNRELEKLMKIGYFENPKITLIYPQESFGGELLKWSDNFALREHCYELTKEILNNEELEEA